MKTLTSLAISQKRHDVAFNVQAIKNAVHDAMTAVENARQKCLIAGSMLISVKEALPFGEFECWVRNNLPEVSERTAERWARAAANVVKVLPPIPHEAAIDVEASVSLILSSPDSELSDQAREWRQQWLDFTADKTIKECLDGVFVDGDPAHRVDRAVNGKTQGGRGNEHAPGRKEFETFIAKHLSAITNMLTYFKNEGGVRVRLMRDLNQEQRSKITLSAAKALEVWPRWMVESLAEKARAELKLSESDRAARRVA